LVVQKGRAMKLSKVHTPEQKDERIRIQTCGGFVTWTSLGQVNVNFHLKTSGVIAEPDTRRFTVQHASDSFLALTTDGINFLLNPTKAADVITQQALQYGSEDSATIVTVPLGSWGNHQSFTSVYSISRSFASSGGWAPTPPSSGNSQHDSDWRDIQIFLNVEFTLVNPSESTDVQQETL
uniref:PPM-type phosphatase domain-containing protein n=1 Tax=Stegastes partitus TaxID=144197 RepID=A0A3B4Z312_9TELE